MKITKKRKTKGKKTQTKPVSLLSSVPVVKKIKLKYIKYSLLDTASATGSGRRNKGQSEQDKLLLR